jgi:hypothetical protein
VAIRGGGLSGGLRRGKENGEVNLVVKGKITKK